MICPKCLKKWMKRWMKISKWNDSKDYVRYVWTCDCGHEITIKENK